MILSHQRDCDTAFLFLGSSIDSLEISSGMAPFFSSSSLTGASVSQVDTPVLFDTSGSGTPLRNHRTLNRFLLLLTIRQPLSDIPDIPDLQDDIRPGTKCEIFNILPPLGLGLPLLDNCNEHLGLVTMSNTNFICFLAFLYRICTSSSPDGGGYCFLSSPSI